MRTASIDIGTNTIRLLICEQTGPASLKKLYIDRVITRLGEGYSDDEGLLTPQAVERSLVALKGFSRIISEHNADNVRAVATSVVRESKNGLEFVNRARNETGLIIEVISGEQEAQLTVTGTLNSVSSEQEHCLICDIGGGSTEYVHVYKGNIVKLVSINLGVVHLTEEFLRSDIESEKELAALSESIKKTLHSELKGFEPVTKGNLSLIATAGTPTTLAAIKLNLNQYNPELINNYVLSKDAITSILERLIKIPKQERAKTAGLEKGREDIIIPGILILLETLEKFSSNKVIVSDGGVLEGIAWRLIK